MGQGLTRHQRGLVGAHPGHPEGGQQTGHYQGAVDPHEPEQMGDQQGDQQGGQGVGPHDQGPEQGGHEVR
ncbi:hypothetical protein D3C74_467790 [compost metagenome]